MPFSRELTDHWWSARSRTYAGSYLAWVMVAVILVLWGLNLLSLVADHRERSEQTVVEYQRQALESKRLHVEALFRAVYEHTRTLSLLPSIRSVTGGNRASDAQDVVAQGRLSVDTHQTIQQIYKNLSSSIRLSEIYYVLDGFHPERGEVPFFMYDEEIVGVNDHKAVEGGSDVPEEYELDEYAYYVRQLQWFSGHYPRSTFGNDITRVPALVSPLMRTCDNTQYNSISDGNVEDTHGLLYSVPVFGLDDQAFKGMISAVVRANVLESALVGVPFIPILPDEVDAARAEGWWLPAEPVGYLLTNADYGIRIFDRRNARLAEGDAALAADGGRIASLKLDVVSDGGWVLHHYLTPDQIASLTAPQRQGLYAGIAARIGLLALLVAIFLKAMRDQRRHHAELVRLAHYDSTTTLPNRSLLFRYLRQSMARTDRHRCRLGLMFVDIDDFGSINDTLGHQVGDRVLMAIADRLRSSIRLSDELLGGDVEESGAAPKVARLGGDDFAIIFEDLPQAEDGVMVGERLLQRFNDPINLDGERVEISLSGGMAVYPDDSDEIDGLMACADYALRHASARGIGQFQMFNDEMRQRAARQTRLMRDLPDAIRHELFTLNYQPKLALAENRVVSFEALIRWHHEEYGPVSPVEFVPLMEQTGLIVDAGRWVLETACRQLKAWQQAGHADLCVSVNVSPRQMILSDIVATVDEVLERTGLAPQYLILEITESIVIDNLEEGCRTLDRLKARGVKLAIDDFGTGYSSLTYLQGLPVDYLKLDKSMIDGIEERKGAHVIQSTIHLAHGLGLVAVAEGVEETHQCERLREMGCDLIQGYWLSRPVTAAECDALLLPRAAQQAG